MSAPRRNFAGIVLDSLPWLAQSLARPLACAFVVWGCWAAGAAAARADNAFPNSQSVLLPRDRPDEIVVATTFGLVFSVDDGATWRYACEDLQTTTGGRKYFVGPPPANRIFALSDLGIPVSNDGACTWTIAGGDVTAMSPFDVFPDPADPLRAYALAKAPNDPDETTGSAYRSFDGGRTFAGPIFTAPPSSVLTGIESAASDPMTVYLTFYELAANGVHPRLATSRDGGDTWTTADLEARLGSLIPRLAAVDPTDPARILLRISSGGGDPAAVDGLVLTTDGGTTFATPFQVPGGSLDGLARLPNGTLFAIGTTARPSSDVAPPPTAFRSDDSGRTFSAEPLAFHPAGLAERNGTLYVATNDYGDGFALASSSDGGRTWRPRLRFRDISGVKDCVRTSCQQDCDFLAGLKLFPPETCNPPPPRSKGCGCALAAPDDGAAGVALGAAALVAGIVLARRRARRR